jgi:signal transduction histidine kinase
LGRAQVSGSTSRAESSVVMKDRSTSSLSRAELSSASLFPRIAPAYDARLAAVMTPVIVQATSADLLERLAAHKTIGGAPRAELQWLADHGQFRLYGVGETIVPMTDVINEMAILLNGHLAIYVDRGTGRRKFMEWRGGDVSGLLPYSRMTHPPGTTSVEEPTEALVIHRDLFPEMIRECPHVTGILVHIMLDRARQFTSTDWQDEKMVSLGRLAAGLAHELNNPASAVARAATLLNSALAEAEDASRALGQLNLSEEERERLEALRDGSLIPKTTGVFSAIERSDREDEIVSWLEEHGADLSSAEALSESGVAIEALDDLAESLSKDTLDAALRWVAAGFTTRTLAADIERASTRIHNLVSAVKRFTYMDRATVSEPSDIGQGLVDTVAVLASKAKAKSVEVRMEIPDDLPHVRAYGGELNQVWSNLIENALDAVESSGQIIVRAAREGAWVVVRVIDDGPGIPSDIQARIFDPFFTTKPVGHGTGLGLDITRRIVRRHDGQIEVDSRPGRTEFRVTLPAHAPQATPTRAEPVLSS